MAALDFLHERSPVAALKLDDKLNAVITRLSAGTDGAPVRLRTGGQVRSWPLPPYRVYYRRRSEGLVIVRIRHQARRAITR
jgi:plasmid stabilization system protein ParE